MTKVLLKNEQEFKRWGLSEMGREYPKRITVKYGNPRSAQQNRFLWGVVYPTLLYGCGLSGQGWTSSDIHEYLLGEKFGWETLEGFGRKRMRPLNRSSNLSKTEFIDYVAFIQQFGAEHGVFVPDPE